MVDSSLIDLTKKEILVTGGSGFLGSYVTEKLVKMGVSSSQIHIPRSKTCDLRDMRMAREAAKNMDVVIHLAANVGGIGYNQKFPGSLFYDNAVMGINLIEASRLENVEKMVLVGTVCAYPNDTPVPFKEDYLWNGYPEVTNAPYGIAKKILLVQAQAYRQQYEFNAIYLLPVNLYGPKDNFHPKYSHVIPALIRKMIDAQINNEKSVRVWGTGSASREFLFVEDAAEAIIQATIRYNDPEPVNLGTGNEITILELVELLKELCKYNGEVLWDSSKPDGQPRRALDITRAKEKFSFEAKTSLREGLVQTINWYRARITI